MRLVNQTWLIFWFLQKASFVDAKSGMHASSIFPNCAFLDQLERGKLSSKVILMGSNMIPKPMKLLEEEKD